MSKYKISIQPEEDGKISIHTLAKTMTEEQFAEFMSDMMNCFCDEYAKGQRIGKLLQESHRTLQGSVARLFLGILVGIGDTDWFDPRNEAAVKMGKQLKQMVDDGSLNMGYMI